MTNDTKSTIECCPEFDPNNWDDKIIEWDNRKFIKEKVCTFFYMPINFGGVMKRLNEKVSKAGATMPDFICLSDHTSKWNMNVYHAVDKEIPNAENILLSGRFYCRVYEGPFQDTGKWCKDYESLTKTKGFTIKKMYMWYTTCPKCAKKYGKNYVVILADINEK
jgi:hypothetical protein